MEDKTRRTSARDRRQSGHSDALHNELLHFDVDVFKGKTKNDAKQEWQMCPGKNSLSAFRL